jgi:acetone carboxylase alpha subunit
MLPPIEIRDGDMLVTDNCAAGGLGDPIERDPSWVKADLDKGLTTAEIARDIYCVSVKFDERAKEWKVSEARTKKLREAKRAERLNRAVPVQDWWQESRKKIMLREMHPLLLEMYQSSMKMSQRFTREFKDFWALPEDFAL